MMMMIVIIATDHNYNDCNGSTNTNVSSAKISGTLDFPYPACSQHLPEGHQDKPSDDWLSRTVARVTASVVAEASTAFGYEVSFTVSASVRLFGGWSLPYFISLLRNS